MDIGRIDPALRADTERAPRLNLENRVVLRLLGTLSGLARGARVDGVRRDVVRAGAVRLRVFVPENPSGAGLVWIHGGGLVMGAAAVDDRFCGETARETGVTVVSVDYRLAPRHPFPAAIDDAHAGWVWLRDNAGRLGLDPARLAVGGQSAGGGLAACLAQRVHDEGEDVAAQWLFCPMLDDRTAVDRSRDAEDHFVWNNRSNLVGWTSYLGDRIGSDALPPYAAAARRTELADLPPTWLYVSDAELFHDEAVDYAKRLEAADVPVELDLVPGAPHGFEAWAAGNVRSQELFARARAWLRERLGT